MKKIVLFSLAAAALAAMAAYTINGSYNSTFGYLTGQDASGNYVSAFGAGAAGYSTGSTRATFVGAASGVSAYYPTDCVGIGYRTLRTSSNCTECVAIGSGAMSGARSCQHCVAIGPDVTIDWSYRYNLVSINNQVIAFPGYMALHPQPLVNEQDEGLDSVSHTSDWRYYDDNGNRPAIEFRTVNDGTTDRTILSFNADEVVISNSSLRIEHVAHADSAQSAEYAGNSGHSVSAEYSYGLQDGGTLNVVSGADILSRIAALEAALVAATNRIAILEAASN